MIKIKKYREEKELKQQNLADELGVSQSLVSLWEKGDIKPRADMLPKLARVLGCSIDDLFGDQDDETKAG